MFGVAPADEERDQAAAQRVEGQAPAEHRSGGRGPLRFGRVAWVVAVVAGPGDGRVDVVVGKRPANQPGVTYAVDAEGARHGRLRLSGVGSDDLQIRLGAKRE